MVYALQKFIHYLLGNNFKLYADNFSLKYLSNKLVLGGTIYRWLLYFQEYHFQVVVKSGRLNVRPNHLSPLNLGENAQNLEDNPPEVQLFDMTMVNEYFLKIVYFLSTWMAPQDYKMAQKKQLVVKVVNYQLIVGSLYKLRADIIFHRCFMECE